MLNSIAKILKISKNWTRNKLAGNHALLPLVLLPVYIFIKENTKHA